MPQKNPKTALQHIIESVIDFSALENLRILNYPGERDLFEELLELYLKTTPGQLNSMRMSFSQGNLASLTKTAHMLKSSSANLGAHRVRAICQELEDRAEIYESLKVSALLDRLKAEYKSAVERLLLELSAPDGSFSPEVGILDK